MTLLPGQPIRLAQLSCVRSLGSLGGTTIPGRGHHSLWRGQVAELGQGASPWAKLVQYRESELFLGHRSNVACLFLGLEKVSEPKA